MPVDTLTIEKVVQSNNSFAFDLFHNAASDQDSNTLLSPYSISNALTMVAAGARGTTGIELGDVLRFPKSCRNKRDKEQPWDVRRVLRGMKQLSDNMLPEQSDAQQQTHCEIRRLKKELDKQQKMNKAERKRKHYDKAIDLADEINALLETVDQYELAVSNSLWCQSGCPFNPDYVELANRMLR